MPSNIRFINKGKSGEIWLYEQVGEGFFGGMSANGFRKEMQALGSVDTINLHINSPGGSVFDGVAIYNQLKSHRARVVVDVDGLAASIASVIAMAGDEIRMADNALMMIHDPYGFAAGDSTEMRKTAELLDQIKGVIEDTYAKRTGLKAEQIDQMMADETWMTAAEAQHNGFADVITGEQKIAACAGFDFSKFKHVPDALLEAIPQSATHSMARVKLAAMNTRLR